MSIATVPGPSPGVLDRVTSLSAHTTTPQAVTPPAGTTVGPAAPTIDVVALSGHGAASLMQAGAMHLTSDTYTVPPATVIPNASLGTASSAAQASSALSSTHVTLPAYVPPKVAGTTQPVSPLALLPPDTTLSHVGKDITNPDAGTATSAPSAIVNAGSLLAAAASKVTVPNPGPVTPNLSHLASQSEDPPSKPLNLVT